MYTPPFRSRRINFMNFSSPIFDNQISRVLCKQNQRLVCVKTKTGSVACVLFEATIIENEAQFLSLFSGNEISVEIKCQIAWKMTQKICYSLIFLWHPCSSLPWTSFRPGYQFNNNIDGQRFLLPTRFNIHSRCTKKYCPWILYRIKFWFETICTIFSHYDRIAVWTALSPGFRSQG